MSEGDLKDFMAAALAAAYLLKVAAPEPTSTQAYRAAFWEGVSQTAYEGAEAMMAERARQLGQQR